MNAEAGKPKSSAPAGAGALAGTAATGGVPDQVMLVAIVSAISSVMWLVLLTQVAALILNPHGRADINRSLAQSGVSEGSRPALLVIYAVILVLIAVVPAVLHAIAFYGLIGRRKAGWIVAFLLAILWSLVLIGIPFVYLLWKRDNRQAYGIS